MATIQGGSVKRVRRQTGTRTSGNVAIPVAFVSSVPPGVSIEGGPARPVRVITDAELRQNGGTFTLAGESAVPMIDAEAGAVVSGGPAIPVYIVAGSIPTPPAPPSHDPSLALEDGTSLLLLETGDRLLLE